ncbi:MAG: hypothetical protein BMS9Abin02_2100 [Anaerolineae bacterium]|nr:MAG: hypothetical protein BMS9Abin02_2100 [Anaerolineae bacterium]
MDTKVKQVGVDCRFMEDGNLMVQALQIDNHWQQVQQGRQWIDLKGRHVLIILPDEQTAEIRLRPDTFNWELIKNRGMNYTVV